MGLIVDKSANPAHAQLRLVADVDGALDLLRAQFANRLFPGAP